MLDNLEPWVAGELTARPQIDGESTVTRKVERDDGRADWAVSAEQLERRCRAYKPWPGLYTQWDGKILKLLDVAVLEPGIETWHGERLPPGSVGPTDCGEAPLASDYRAGNPGVEDRATGGAESRRSRRVCPRVPQHTGRSTLILRHPNHFRYSGNQNTLIRPG